MFIYSLLNQLIFMVSTSLLVGANDIHLGNLLELLIVVLSCEDHILPKLSVNYSPCFGIE